MADLLKILQEQGEKLNFISTEAATKLKAELEALGYSFIVDEKKNPEYIPKARLDDELQKKDIYKQQLDEQNKTIEDLKKSAGDKDKTLEQLQAAAKKAQELEAKLNEVSLHSAIKLKVSAGDYMAHDPGDILRMLDHGKLKLNGENVDGLEDQLKSLKETKAYLFTGAAKPPVGGGTNPPAGGGAAGGAGDYRAALAAGLGIK